MNKKSENQKNQRTNERTLDCKRCQKLQKKISDAIMNAEREGFFFPQINTTRETEVKVFEGQEMISTVYYVQYVTDFCKKQLQEQEKKLENIAQI